MYLSKKGGVFAIIFLAAFITAMYLTYSPEKCQDYACFKENMESCNAATFINEDPKASWGYKIKGTQKNECEIEVTLLQAKEGDLSLEKYNGHSMTCYYPKGRSAYPEKDLSLCHGVLKEDLQTIIIQKLHQYLLDNLIQIEEELKSI